MPLVCICIIGHTCGATCPVDGELLQPLDDHSSLVACQLCGDVTPCPGPSRTA